MSQIDPLIISPVLCFLLPSLVIHYNMVIESLVPDFFSVKKFRNKKLKSVSSMGYSDIDTNIYTTI